MAIGQKIDILFCFVFLVSSHLTWLHDNKKIFTQISRKFNFKSANPSCMLTDNNLTNKKDASQQNNQDKPHWSEVQFYPTLNYSVAVTCCVIFRVGCGQAGALYSVIILIFSPRFKICLFTVSEKDSYWLTGKNTVKVEMFHNCIFLF